MLRFFYISILFCAITMHSCIIVKHEEEEQISHKIVLSEKPEIELSEEIIRSRMGDMIAFLPKGWMLIDVEDKVSSDVFCVAVNPEHTLSIVFSVIRKNELVNSIFEKEGLMGLARLSFSKKDKKTSGTLKQVGKFMQVEIGSNVFVKYDYVTPSNSFVTRVAVFASSLNEFYEFSLIPLDILGNQHPKSEEVDKIFRSILTSIKY